GRKLTELRLNERPVSLVNGWYEFFGEHVPRILGIAVLALGGVALARAGDAALPYVGIAVTAFFAPILARRFVPKLPPAIPTLLIPQSWGAGESLAARLG